MKVYFITIDGKLVPFDLNRGQFTKQTQKPCCQFLLRFYDLLSL